MNRCACLLLVAAIVALWAVLPAASAAERGQGPPDQAPRVRMERPEGPPHAPPPTPRPEPGRPPRPAPEPGQPPRPIVLRFLHIPAESFIETLKQLGRNPHVADALRELPIALNEPANSVVLLAPPDAAEPLLNLARQLDQPNELAIRMREKDREDAAFRHGIEQEKRGIQGPPSMRGPGRGPPFMGRPGEKGPPMGPPQAMRGPGAIGGRGPGQGPPFMRRPGEQGPPMGPPHAMRGPGWMGGRGPGARPEQAPMPPRPGADEGLGRLGLLMAPEARERLGLSPEQAERIRGIVAEARKGFEHLGERVREALRDVPPEKRGERMREMMERAQGERGRRAQEIREQIMRVLTPPQREKVEQWMRGAGPLVGRPPEGRPPEGRGPEERRPEPRPPEGRRPEEHRPEPRPPAEPQRRPEGGPGAGEGLGRLGLLMGPDARERLGLSPEQAERIRGILAGAREGMEHLGERVREAMKDVPPEARGERMREMMEKMEGERARRMQGIREEVMKVLTPPQREKFEQWMREAGPTPGRPREGRTPEPGPPPAGRRPAAAPASDAPAAPAVQGAPARFRLVQGGAEGDRGGRPEVSAAEREKWVNMARKASSLRQLEDSDIRSKLDLSKEQDDKLTACQEKARQAVDRIRDRVRLQFGQEDAGKTPSAEEAQVRERDMRRAMWEAFRAAQPTFEGLLEEASGVLNEEQMAQLQRLAQERQRLASSSGYLWVLITDSGRKELGLTDELVEKIKKILDEVARQVDEKRQALMQVPQDLPPEERGQAMRARYGEFAKEQQALAEKAKTNVFALLTPEQREKAEKLMADAQAKAAQWGANFLGPNRGGAPRRDFRPPGAPGAAPPAPAAPPTPAPLPADPPPPPSTPAAPVLHRDTDVRHYLVQDVTIRSREGGVVIGDANGQVHIAQGEASEAQRKEWVERARTRSAYRSLEDAEMRSALDLAADQEAQVAKSQEAIKKILERAQDQARQRFGQDAPGAADEEAEKARQRDVQRAMWEALRAAQPKMDELMKAAADTLTGEQRARLEALAQERARFQSSSGFLWVLLTKKARDELGLSDEVVARIRTILQETADRAQEARKALQAGLQDLPAEERGQEMRRRYETFAKDSQQLSEKAKASVFALLTSDQPEKAERLMADARSRPGTPGGWTGFGSGVFIGGQGGPGRSIAPPGPPASVPPRPRPQGPADAPSRPANPILHRAAPAPARLTA